MKNGPLFLAFLSLVLSGCTSSYRDESTTTSIELVRMTTLPPYPSLASSLDLRITVLFGVQPDGTVAEVRLLGPSGDPDWDQAAADSLKGWRFTPAPRDSAVADRWVRIAIIARARESRMIAVGELHSDRLPEADSLCALLKAGADFEVLCRQLRPGTTAQRGRIDGPVDLATFPQRIRQKLQELAVDGFTEPIRVGSEFIIYKRLKTDSP